MYGGKTMNLPTIQRLASIFVVIFPWFVIAFCAIFLWRSFYKLFGLPDKIICYLSIISFLKQNRKDVITRAWARANY